MDHHSPHPQLFHQTLQHDASGLVPDTIPSQYAHTGDPVECPGGDRELEQVWPAVFHKLPYSGHLIFYYQALGKMLSTMTHAEIDAFLQSNSSLEVINSIFQLLTVIHCYDNKGLMSFFSILNPSSHANLVNFHAILMLAHTTNGLDLGMDTNSTLL